VGGPFQGQCPASDVNDGSCPEKPDHLTAAGLRVIQLLPDQHHLSNVMSLITSSLNTQTHSSTVVGVKRLERETVYILFVQRTHVVPI
jgi:hypothetical protein